MQCHWWSSDKRIENYICRTKNWFNKQSKRYPHISHILNRGPKIFTDRIFFVKMSHWVNGFYYIPLAKSNMSIFFFHTQTWWFRVIGGAYMDLQNFRSDDRITEKFNDRRNGPWYFRGPFYQYQHQLTFSTFIWQYFVGSRWICPMVMLDWDFIMEFTVVLNPKRYSFDLWPNCIARAPTYIGAVCCVWTQINKIPKLTHQKARGDLKNTLSSLQHRLSIIKFLNIFLCTVADFWIKMCKEY